MKKHTQKSKKIKVMKRQKVSDYFETNDIVSKHDEGAYRNVDMTILGLNRLICSIEEKLSIEESAYDFNEDCKGADMVEVIRYNQKQAINLLHERLMNFLWEYYYDADLVDDEKK
jgi:hypothetical protein